jgi:rhodanese-related sulfurtransferase
MRIKYLFLALIISGALVVAVPTPAESARKIAVKISQDVAKFQVKHGRKKVTVVRNQNTRATIPQAFSLTSRKCPPFCAQPMLAAPGVATIGELELVAFMMNELKYGKGLLIDARTPDWHARGTIPGAINIPYIEISRSLGADDISIEDALQRLGAKLVDDNWDFSRAKKVVLWCNGPWCGQSPTAIRGLLELNYPAEKILY